MTQEIINRLKELLAKADVLPLSYRPWQYDDWGTIRGGGTDEREESLHFIASVRDSRVDRDTYPQHRAAKTDPYEAVTRLFVEGLNALPALLATLTPSEGVERITDEMVKAGAKAIMGCNGGFTLWQFWREDARACLTAALALPSEPPSQGDVEGRAKMMLAGELANAGWSDIPTARDPTVDPAVAATVQAALRAIANALASKEDGRS